MEKGNNTEAELDLIVQSMIENIEKKLNESSQAAIKSIDEMSKALNFLKTFS